MVKRLNGQGGISKPPHAGDISCKIRGLHRSLIDNSPFEVMSNSGIIARDPKTGVTRLNKQIPPLPQKEAFANMRSRRAKQELTNRLRRGLGRISADYDGVPQ